MSLLAKEINRRRHIRWKIEKQAMLVLPCSNPVLCTIYDFCSNGLFLEFEQAEESVFMHQRQLRQAKVSFTMDEKKDQKDFQFDVEIMRVCSNGVGVGFQNIPMIAFKALVNQANLVSVPVSLGNLDNLPDQVNKKKFEKTFMTLLGEALPMILKEFFRLIDQEMIKISRQVENQAEKKHYFNAYATLKSNQKELVSKFCNAVLKEVRYMDNSTNEGNIENFNKEDNQPAVNKAEINDWIDLSSLIRRTESKYEKQLSSLEQKLSQGTGIPVNQINNPLTPAKLCYSFRAVLGFPVEKNDVMKAFNQMFGDVLISQLDSLYQQFDRVLSNQDKQESVACNNSKQSESLPNKNDFSEQQDLNLDQPDIQPITQERYDAVREPELSKA